MKMFQIDYGGEFMEETFQSYLKSEGIDIQKSEPHVHQQNGHMEHIHHTLMDKSEAM